jgi:hypothetical protein
MSFILMDLGGRHAGFSNVEGRSYIYQTDGMDEPEEVDRILVETDRRWGE